ncbi:enoyl-CoA hydratase/isomerase family protein [Cupriavidus numazuensis]|uniref:Fatty acid oxidation complex subunit alpha n=1 Tax=Cupriavidus numazuensis TaxID=221992 RepID=A0ABN7Q0D5_9BURK|nr:enoyl-CoA hydratase/isomerase family protein [Cupriavidus numazuensis]CAG2144945.1 Fatty acid oxidation complex subunit alpha [Cupriavidus numazuensis]
MTSLAYSPAPTLPDAAAPVRTHVRNGIGFIVLDRPQALNALSLPMIQAMQKAIDAWRERADVHAVVVSPSAAAFCAGADVRYLHELSRRGDVRGCHRYFKEEYSLDHAIFTYPKPCIALMAGVVMGGGMGLAQGARRTGGLRVVTGTTQMAMPETRIGFFPDVGAAWFLSRTPGALGRYLAVTGTTIGPGDALHAGLADIYMDDADRPSLLARLERETLRDGNAVVACIREAARPHCLPTPVADTQPWIDHHFRHDSVARIMASLASEMRPGAREWAAATLAVMRQRSPLSMAVALEVLVRPPSSMADSLRRDFVLALNSFADGDAVEGVRARLIDKDNRPAWRIADSEDVRTADVARLFASPWSAGDHPLRHLAD